MLFRLSALAVGTFLISIGCANRAGVRIGHEYEHFVFKPPPTPSPFLRPKRSVSLYGATSKFPQPGPTELPKRETQVQKVVRYVHNWALTYKDDAGNRAFDGSVSVNKRGDEITITTYSRDWTALNTDQQGIMKQNALDVVVESYCLTSMKQHQMIPRIIVRFADSKGTVLASERTEPTQVCRQMVVNFTPSLHFIPAGRRNAFLI